MTLKKLPTFETYTIDFKLKQFRDVRNNKEIEFISFDSKKGVEILREMREKGYTTPPMIFYKNEWMIDADEC